jgi:membrane protease YdiL (CAAX protease family)
MPPVMTLHEITWIDHVVAVVLCLIAPIMAVRSRQEPEEEIDFEPGDKIKLYHSNALLLIVFALVVITVWRLPGRPMTGLGFSWPVINPLVLQLTGVILLLYFLDYFFQYGTKRWRERSLKEKHGAIHFVPVDFRELTHFLFLALAAGICEEIIFRGYLMHYFLYWAGNTPIGIAATALCSSILFAFLHGYQGLVAMIKIFIFSLLFAAIFIFSKSLLLVMLIHTVIDIVSGWVGIYLLKQMKASEPQDQDQP